jgi:hypothetical protein
MVDIFVGKILIIIGNGPTRLLLGLCVLLFISVLLLGPNISAKMKAQDLINCDIHEGPCILYISGHKVTLNILPKPVKAMKDLKFRVTISGEQLSSHPHIDLGMPGMKMGPNRVVLKGAGEGNYEGVGVIVRCPSGRRTWRATVTLPNLGEVKFIFDVIY